MRIAIPTADEGGVDGEVFPHFGRAPTFTLIDVEDGEIKRVEVIENSLIDHSPGDLPTFLKERGVEILIGYGVGRRAQDFFMEMGVKVISGASGRVEDVVKSYLKGDLRVDEDWKEREGFSHH